MHFSTFDSTLLCEEARMGCALGRCFRRGNGSPSMPRQQPPDDVEATRRGIRGIGRGRCSGTEASCPRYGPDIPLTQFDAMDELKYQQRRRSGLGRQSEVRVLTNRLPARHDHVEGRRQFGGTCTARTGLAVHTCQQAAHVRMSERFLRLSLAEKQKRIHLAGFDILPLLGFLLCRQEADNAGDGSCLQKPIF